MMRTEATSAASGVAIEFRCRLRNGTRVGDISGKFRPNVGTPPNPCDPICVRPVWEGMLHEPFSAASRRKTLERQRGHHEQAKEAVMSSLSSANETYQHGHHVSVVANHAKRTADTAAAFFLPFLKPGMRLLDVGCGPGSITAGLAKRVEPAETIGIDPSASVIATARSLAEGKAGGHLTFEVGNIYEPRFAPETFDAVFAHQVLQHLARPVDALRQVAKLLKPGGVV